MKNKTAFLSRGIVYFMALTALSICVFLLPELAREATAEDPAMAHLHSFFLLGAYLLAVPFFAALGYTHRLFSYISGDDAFSHQSVKALRNIKLCTCAFGAMVTIGSVLAIFAARSINPNEDVTHIIILGLIFIFIASVIGVFVAVLQKLLQQAITIKHDNELIV